AWVILNVSGPPVLTSGGDQGITPWEYIRSQPEIILHYFRLAIWPSGLTLDYWWPVSSVGRAVPFAIGLGVIALSSLWLLIKRNPVGYLGAWVFVILAPTSSGASPLNLAFEHRMYLPLAAFAALFACGGYLLIRRYAQRLAAAHNQTTEQAKGDETQERRSNSDSSESPREPMDPAHATASLGRIALIIVVVILSMLTLYRNLDYTSEYRIWADTVAKRPQNHRAHTNLGIALHHMNKLEDAAQSYRNALAIDPLFEEALSNLGAALIGMKRPGEAVPYFETALRVTNDPRKRASIFNNLGSALFDLDRQGAALTCFYESLFLQPQNPGAHSNIAFVYRNQGRLSEALEHAELALEQNPDYTNAHATKGLVLAEMKRYSDAEYHLRRAAGGNPNLWEVFRALGKTLIELGNTREAEAALLEALRIQPGDEESLELLEQLQQGNAQ
ncbi:MAG: tetratricopeptide repeat protein, partial [Desulfovibrio sp.]